MSSKQLNSFNFLRWYGEFEDAVYENVANDDVGVGVYTVSYIDIAALDNDTSTIGIDFDSIIITQQVYIDVPAIYDPVSHNIRFYTKTGTSAPGSFELKYKWFDLQGNPSNEATITIYLQARTTGWRGISPTCDLSGGDNTGYYTYATLQQFYTDNGAATGITKPNVDTDPDYIAPIYDESVCPIHLYVLINSKFQSTPSGICEIGFNSGVYANSSDVTAGLPIGTVLYTDSGLSIPVGFGYYVISGIVNSVNSGGVIYDKVSC